MTPSLTPKRQPSCPYCKRAMDEGFVIDRGHHSSANVQQWAEGEPVKHWFHGIQAKSKERKEVRSYRCPDCGLLQDYAL